ncbi:MAG: hypothetical protein E7510_13845 [Ruminococcus sp.]|nr:hypothetical protein [Ruminococcus sp.]
MKFDFPNEIDKIEIDISLPEPVYTIEEKNEMLRKKFAKVNIAIFSVLLAATSIFMVVFERPKISEAENRTLATLPKFSVKSLMDGSFTNGVSDYYNDTVPFRSTFKNMAASFKSHAGIEKDGVKIYTINKGENSTQKKPVTTPATEAETVTTTVASEITQDENIVSQAPVITTTEATTTTTPPIPEDDPMDAGELSNDIMIYKNRGIPIYYGSQDSALDYASIVNTYKQQLGPDVNVYSMICPTAISFYWPPSSDISHGSEIDNMILVKNKLVDVIDINSYDILMEHRAEHIYSRTDHHWQPLGAYYASQIFAQAANVPFDDISCYEKVTVPGYVGSLYGFSGAAALNDNPEDFVFFRPDNEYTTHYYSTGFVHNYDGALLVEAYGSALYCTFMGGDEKIVHVETDAPNDRTLFIIKDSYGNALVPFLTNSFKNIYVIDMRYFDLNIITFMQEHGVTDLLFAMNTFSATGSNYRNLERIRTQ